MSSFLGAVVVVSDEAVSDGEGAEVGLVVTVLSSVPGLPAAQPVARTPRATMQAMAAKGEGARIRPSISADRSWAEETWPQ